jgi:hypothetical protein
MALITHLTQAMQAEYHYHSIVAEAPADPAGKLKTLAPSRLRVEHPRPSTGLRGGGLACPGAGPTTTENRGTPLCSSPRKFWERV